MSSAFSSSRAPVNLRKLIGAGDRIGLLTLPFLLVGVGLNIAFPEVFSVGGPPVALTAVSLLALAVGVSIWAWSIGLIMTRVPRGQLITSGPYAVVRHPLYTAVSLLVLPSLGLLLNTWLGVVIGVVMYGAARVFAPAEERELARAFGPAWTAYSAQVMIPWL